jgi:hypothetical protein
MHVATSGFMLMGKNSVQTHVERLAHPLGSFDPLDTGLHLNMLQLRRSQTKRPHIFSIHTHGGIRDDLSGPSRCDSQHTNGRID